jgi:hypothetical protein
MIRRRLGILLALVVTLISSCRFLVVASEEQIATAIAETNQAEEISAFYDARTQEALATETPVPTSTDTPIPSDTPLPTSTFTPEAPAGMAYLPDLVGMPYVEASEILIDLDSEKWYYVAVINRQVDEWTVIDQEPEPGTLFDLGDDRVKIIVAVYKFTPTPQIDKGGKQSSDPCGGITYAGICQSNVVYWCQNNVLYYYDCSWCGGVCAWNDAIGFYCTCW